MSEDLKVMTDCIAQYRSGASAGKSVADMDARLAVLSDNVSKLSLFAMNDRFVKEEERKTWSEHGKAFRAVVLSSLKMPGYSLKQLSAPVAYNLGPILYDEQEAVIYADVAAPDQARVAKTFDKNRKLHGGDEIVAYRDDEDEPWKDVHSWRDLVHTRGDAGEDEGKQQIHLKVRRGRSIKEVEVGFVASTYTAD